MREQAIGHVIKCVAEKVVKNNVHYRMRLKYPISNLCLGAMCNTCWPRTT